MKTLKANTHKQSKRNGAGVPPMMAWALPALAMMLGLQLLRVIVPLWLYVLRDRIGWTAVQIGVLALGMFALSFLAGGVNRALGTRRAFLLTGGGVALARLFFQLWPGDPLVNMVVAMVGGVGWLWFWPILLGGWREASPSSLPLLGRGILLGVAFDLALHGAYGSYDMAWRDDLATAVITFLLIALFGWLLWQAGGRIKATNDPSGKTAWLWLAFGPYLFLQMIIFNNLAGVTAVIGWSLSVTFLWMMVGHLVGIVLATGLDRVAPRRQLWLLLPTLLLVGVMFNWEANAYAGWWFVGQLLMAVWLTRLIPPLADARGEAGLRHLTIGHGAGMFLMTVLLFLFYTGYDLPLPFENVVLLPIAAVVLGLMAIGATWQQPVGSKQAIAPQPRLLWGVMGLLLLVPSGRYLLTKPAQPISGNGYPLKVMSYNVHNGFNPQGDLDMEAIAELIEAEGVDVVALQEVSRGWVVNGAVDMADWLAQRLQMPYQYAPTTGPMWGMAILSRYPIVETAFFALPPEGLLLQRGVLWTAVDVGNGQIVNILNTHYHHIEADSEIRVQQSAEVLANLPTGATVLMGDLNAQPTDPEMVLLELGGFHEALQFAGDTYPADAPTRRIDYIWLSGELTAVNGRIIPTPASDHLAIMATIELGDGEGQQLPIIR